MADQQGRGRQAKRVLWLTASAAASLVTLSGCAALGEIGDVFHGTVSNAEYRSDAFARLFFVGPRPPGSIADR